MQFIAIELQPFDEFLDGALGLEWKKRKTECDVSPLSGIFAESEPLTQLLDHVLRLLFL